MEIGGTDMVLLGPCEVGWSLVASERGLPKQRKRMTARAERQQRVFDLVYIVQVIVRNTRQRLRDHLGPRYVVGLTARLLAAVAGFVCQLEHRTTHGAFIIRRYCTRRLGIRNQNSRALLESVFLDVEEGRSG